MSERKIYVFSNVPGGGDGICYALADDGVVLGSHLCSHEAYARLDLGVVAGSRPDRHAVYAKHFPDGYEMVFVPAAEVATHTGLRAAYALNQQQASSVREDAFPECDRL